MSSSRSWSYAQTADQSNSPPPPGSEGFGPSRSFRLVTEHVEWPWGSEDRPLIESRIDGKRQKYRLPQSTIKAVKAARPDQDGAERINEHIGLTQVVDNVLWFGKTFYNGEGFSGVGGFGYFDPADRQFHIFTGPEIADWSVDGMVVESDFVWLSLGHHGELSSPTGGLVRFDRRTARFERVLSDAGGGFLRIRPDLMLVLGKFLTVLRDGHAERYFVDQTTSGMPRVVPALP